MSVIGYFTYTRDLTVPAAGSNWVNPIAINHGSRRRHFGVTAIGAVSSTMTKNPISERTKNNSTLGTREAPTP